MENIYISNGETLKLIAGLNKICNNSLYIETRIIKL